VVHQIIAADIAFTAHVTGQALHSVYMRTLNSLYQSKYSRELIKSMAISMYDRMCDVDRITEQEEESLG
jgi:hypothetical protein